jgi:nicotinamidase-related amidase
MTPPRLRAPHTAILVVDIQEKLLPHMHNAPAVAGQTRRLVAGAAALGLPVLATEQYRQGLGQTVPEVADALTQAQGLGPYEKLKFSAWIEPVRAALIERQARSVIVCGIEAHVCVLQTCLDLVDAGYLTAVAMDAIGSRHPADQDAAVLRLTQAGVVPTTVESALLELTREAGTELFRRVLGIIR